MEEIIDSGGSASSHRPEGWHAIDWRRVDGQVRTMQMRIAKATQEGDWRRVKALQRSLTRSFSARAVSVRRVTENQGKRTAGVDRELWETPASKWTAVSNVSAGAIGAEFSRTEIAQGFDSRPALVCW